MSKITLRAGSAPEDAMAVARDVAEQHGYLWEQQSATVAEATEGGKPVGKSGVVNRLKVVLAVDDGQLTLDQPRDSSTYTTAAAVPFLIVRKNFKASSFHKKVSKALKEAQLA